MQNIKGNIIHLRQQVKQSRLERGRRKEAAGAARTLPPPRRDFCAVIVVVQCRRRRLDAPRTGGWVEQGKNNKRSTSEVDDNEECSALL